MKIAAVIVTYNSLDYLKQCVEGVRNQIYRVDQIIVVNNCEKDETAEWLSYQEHIVSINQKNTGGAGGFNIGIGKAYEQNFDWIWCLDHDIEVKEDTLDNLIHSKAFSFNNLGFLSSLVMFDEHEISYINVPLLPSDDRVILSLASRNEIPILCSSFGSVLLSRKAVSIAGLPIQDFFIWGDDSEYTIRMIQLGFKGYLIINSLVYHRSIDNEYDALLVSDFKTEKAGIGLRNKIYLSKLRNELLYSSKLRGILASFNYLFKIIKHRSRSNRIKLITEGPLILKFFIKGLFYSPRKFLPPEIRNKLKNNPN